ncbi:MAG: DNA-directed RNA polymerase subunit alpha [Actinobacteria bacterium RBG_16_64_13]|nr:MAG: DNA-directed RNA polymerase subunit alpha [Actinobacteria bacterium RBG_16_64_13]
MLDFATPHNVYEPAGENRGRFTVEPLARGFGYTFGNLLRRVLLSSLEGAAISAVKISGVEHEFSTVPHVKEDVTDIILNLKKTVFVLHGEADEHEVMLVKDGPGEITAGDIDLPAAVEVMNPAAYVGTLEDGGRLEMRLTVRRGRGYVSADDNKRPGTALGVIPIDSIFSPVTRVAYSVEPARVGQRTDFDKLTLEVETNGAVDPRTAVSLAASLVRDELGQIFLVDVDDYATERPVEAAEGPEPEDDMLIDDLDLGVRSLNCLKREGIETVGDLIAKSEQELMCIPNFGRKSLDEVRERLEKNNLKLRGE